MSLFHPYPGSPARIAGVNGRVRATAPKNTIKHWMIYPRGGEVLNPNSPLARDVFKTPVRESTVYTLGGVEVLSERTYKAAHLPPYVKPAKRPFDWYFGAGA